MGSRSNKPSRRNPKPEPNKPKSVKIVLVGDSCTGKSCLMVNYEQQVFSEDYEPNVQDVIKGPKQFEGKQIELEIHDTSGCPSLGVNRQVCYNKTDCFMLCVALNSQASLENVMKWRTEIRQVCPDAPIILVGTKADLRGIPVDSVSGQDLKQKSDDMGLQDFCETSAKNW